MHVLLVSNRKGGTGKTATVVNLSAEFSRRGYKVLLVDLDSQANATLGLGFEASKIQKSIHKFLSGELENLQEALLPTKWGNLFLLPGDPMFEHHQILEDSERLRRALYELSNFFDFVFIDTAPSLDSLLVNALKASHFVVIPFLPHYLSLEGIKSLVRVFFRVAVRDNTELRLAGLLPVMFNPRLNQHRWVIEEIKKNFGEEKLLPSIRTDIKVAEAFQAHKPLLYYAPYSKALEDYKTLADRLLEIILSYKISKNF